jgi:hypothetical protein
MMTAPQKHWKYGRPGSIRIFQSLEPALQFASESATELILDIEPWLVAWDQPADTLESSLRTLGLYPIDSTVVILCTNSRRFKVTSAHRIITAAHKPWTRRQRIARPMVCGDSLILDGLLAQRLGADFLWVRWNANAPIWPKVLQLIDRLMAKILSTEVQL